MGTVDFGDVWREGGCQEPAAVALEPEVLTQAIGITGKEPTSWT
jgi:hypothetical protein